MKIFIAAAIGIVSLVAGIALRLGNQPARGIDWATALDESQPASFSLDSYDLINLGSWALMIIGGVVIAASLVAFYRTAE